MLSPFASLDAAENQPAKPADKPNIIFMMADDIGWTDSATYSNKYYETPNIDLRRRGYQVRSAPPYPQEHAALKSVAHPATLHRLATLIRVTFHD